MHLYQPAGSADSSVYAFQNLRLYIDAVYLRGALMLQAIRETIGDTAFYTWLHNYAAAEAGKIATPLEFWQAMTPEDYARIADIRAKYLHQPDPLHPPSPTVPTQSATQAATGIPRTAVKVTKPARPMTAIPTTR